MTSTSLTLGSIQATSASGLSVKDASNNNRLTITSSNITAAAPVSLNSGMTAQRTLTLSGNYSANTWYEIASHANLTLAGTYVITAYVDTFNAGGAIYYMTYSSVPFYWWAASNSNSVSTFQLPTMYGTGHADNNQAPPTIRLRLTGGSSGVFIDMLTPIAWSGINGTSGRNVIFYFQRIA
jgi:hypothetical protein